MFSLIPYHRMLSNLSGTRNSLANDPFFRPFMDMGGSLVSNFRVDIRERDNAYLLEAELPGVSKDKINLTVDKDVLTISADIDSQRKDEKENYCYVERRSGHVERSFSIEGIDHDKIQASYEDGILRVELPKQKPLPEKSSRKIEIGDTPKLDSPEQPA